MIPWSNQELDQATSDPKPLFFTVPKNAEFDTPITIAHDEPIKRTMSAVEVLGLQANSEWDDADAMMPTDINMRASGGMGVEGQKNADTSHNFIKRAKQESNASPYIKVLCRFKAGENEVQFSLCSPCPHP